MNFALDSLAIDDHATRICDMVRLDAVPTRPGMNWWRNLHRTLIRARDKHRAQVFANQALLPLDEVKAWVNSWGGKRERSAPKRSTLQRRCSFAPGSNSTADLQISSFMPILLKKSKIERLTKSRESRYLDVSPAAMLARGDTKVLGRFCERCCGPSRRGVRNASAVLKNFARQPEKTFSTVSAKNRHRKAAHRGGLIP
jgi:hypothetical protein